MGGLKHLFKTKEKEPEQRPQEDFQEASEQVRITYYQSGYGASIKAQGEALTFATGLQNLYNSFENLCRKQLNEQKRLKQPYVEAREGFRTDLKKRETALLLNQQRKEQSEEEIADLKSQIIRVQQDPTEFGISADKRPKAQFYIGLAILLPITIYLFVFYISASYSAFFKDFEDDSLTAAIFDANAFGKALSDGWLEALFVGTIPFVFMGLGYLIHMFQHSKSRLGYLKLAALLILTFFFDVILAYLIEQKIFDFNKMLGDSFSPSIAVQSVNFWGIIFAGFVVYIIWGLVFDFVMKEYENLDKVRNFVTAKKNEIFNAKESIKDTEGVIDQITEQITSIKGQIAELQAKIDGFVFPIKEYLHYHYQYKEGWYQAINSELKFPPNQLEDLRNQCEIVEKHHLEQLNLSDTDFQHLVYSKN